MIKEILVFIAVVPPIWATVGTFLWLIYLLVKKDCE